MRSFEAIAGIGGLAGYWHSVCRRPWLKPAAKARANDIRDCVWFVLLLWRRPPATRLYQDARRTNPGSMIVDDGKTRGSSAPAGVFHWRVILCDDL